MTGLDHGAGLFVPVAQVAQRHIEALGQFLAAALLLAMEMPVFLQPPDDFVLKRVALLESVRAAHSRLVRRNRVQHIDGISAFWRVILDDEADHGFAGFVGDILAGSQLHTLHRPLREHEVWHNAARNHRHPPQPFADMVEFAVQES